MSHSQPRHLCRLGFAVILTTTFCSPSWGQTQITPDATLGAENSTIGAGMVDGNPVQFIEGGAARGSNVFHSFSDFHVGTEAVYFANPAGIENILSRITGSNVSYIDGLLGVDGAANLFLLNPNGVIFGPNARLDISGAFAVSTADSLIFADGSEFRAAPQGDALLSISVPLGLRLDQPTQGYITSMGVLTTGSDLTLQGHDLYLEGQLLAGGDLTLQAEDTVTIRDTATNAFVARSGSDLMIQGNQGIDIWTLQHLEQTPFVSGGNLALISDGVISGDAHFESGGSLQLLTLAGTPGNFVSFYDPIIFADGDVVFGDYTGVALKVEATGSIQAGNIRITGPDTTLVADESDPDTDLLASSRAVILRAGVESADSSTVPQAVGETTFEAGTVTGEPPGSIVVSSIDTSAPNESGEDGGPIILSSRSGNINIQGGLWSYSNSDFADAGNGGAVTITSQAGNITIFSIDSISRSAFENSQLGGEITLSTQSGNITIDGSLQSGSITGNGFAATSGTITVASQSGNILINGDLRSGSGSNNGVGGLGGRINLSSQFGDIVVNGSIDTSSLSENVGDAGDAGDVNVFSDSGDIHLESVTAYSYTVPLAFPSSPGDAGNGGDVSLFTRSGDISLGFVNTSSSSLLIEGGETGVGGNVTIEAPRGSIRGTHSDSTIHTFSANEGNELTDAGGRVRLTAANRITGFDVATISETANSGDVTLQNTTVTPLIVEDVNLVTSAQAEFQTQNSEVITLILDNVGQSGNTLIGSASDIVLNNVEIQADANGNQPAGNVTITSPGQVTFNNSQINSNANSIGSAGLITITADQLSLGEEDLISASTIGSGRAGSIAFDIENTLAIDGGSIESNTNSQGNAGAIDIDTGQLIISNGGRILATTTGVANGGDGGDIRINATEATLSGDGSGDLEDAAISVATFGSGTAGDIAVTITDTLEIDGSIIASSTEEGSTGLGGSILFADATSMTLRNNGKVTVDSRGEGRGGDIMLNSGELSLLNESTISSSTRSSNGGNLLFTLRDNLSLRNASRISTAAGTAQAGGDGGDITILTTDGFIIAVPDENSDIDTTASFGAGGDVYITTLGLLGIDFRPELPPLSDITANSVFGLDGAVTVDEPNLEISEIELPVDTALPPLAQSCRPQGSQASTSQNSSFVITGHGGLPTNPTDSLSADTIWQDLAPFTAPSFTTTDPVSSRADSAVAAADTPFVEAQSGTLTENGTVVLLAHQVETFNHSHQIPSFCPNNR